MNWKRVAGAALAGGVGVASASAMLTSPAAHAADTVSVAAGACRSIVINASGADTGTAYTVRFDGIGSTTLNGGAKTTRTNLWAGRYSYIVTKAGATETGVQVVTSGVISVAACTTSTPKRPVQGDQNADGRADVLGVKATGDLFYYRMQSNLTLASGVKAGHGWQNSNWMQQVNELTGVGTGNYLLARRTDGTLWRYTNKGKGNIYGGVQIGSGFGGYRNLSVLPLDNTFAFGRNVLMASAGSMLYGWEITASGLGPRMELFGGWDSVNVTMGMQDFDGDGFGDIVTTENDGTMWAEMPRPGVFEWTTDNATDAIDEQQVGSGWTIMSATYSAGDETLDGLNDVIARRRDDGNLYMYVNQAGSWAAGRKIGANWNGIRMFC